MSESTLATELGAVKEVAAELNDVTPAVILVRPREDGNVGSVARAMANMGLSRLVLVDPRLAGPELGTMAWAFAHGAHFVLHAATRAPTLDAAVAPFRLVVGTSSTREREDRREVLMVADLPAAIAARGVVPGEVALVFGPEISGLTNEDMARCGLLVNIPCAPVQPTLNLAQAVLVVSWELRRAALLTAASVEVAGQPRPVAQQPAAAAAVAGLLERGEALLRRVAFARSTTFVAVLRDLRALAGRAALSEREVAILGGVVRRLGHALDRGAGASGKQSTSRTRKLP